MADLNERELFPDRGVKVEQGRVYQEMAFGSTRPRGMMPGHLAVDIPEFAKRNIKRRQARLRKIEAASREADKRREDVYHVISKHRKRREDYLNLQQLKKFHSAIKVLNSADEGLRPSDKAGAFRDYSALDKSLWELDELRDWFNKVPPGGTPRPHPSAYNPGYTVPRQASSRHSGSRPTSVSSVRSSARQAMARSGSHPSLKTTERKSHWLDFEGALKEQRGIEDEMRKTGALDKAISRKPWKDRPPEDEGDVVSVSELRAREEKLFVPTEVRMAALNERQARTQQMREGAGPELLRPKNVFVN